MKRKEILSLLNHTISREINLDDDFKIPVRTEARKKFLGEEPKVVEHINVCSYFIAKYFQKVLGWLPANPSKKNIVDAINLIYVFTAKKATDPNNFVNTEEGHQKFFIELTENSEIQTFFLVGPKGSGKTFYLNYLVNTKAQDIYDKKIIWYRAELSKLYKHNITLNLTNTHENEEGGKPYTLEEYFNIHIAYVSFKYRKQNFRKFLG